MAIWNKSAFLLFVRFIPIILVLTLSVFWSSEKNLRLTLERKSEENITRLMAAEERMSAMSRDVEQLQSKLHSAEIHAERVFKENQMLISQLGQRDEHIRRLLAEMIQLLSNNRSVNLGSITVPTDASKWEAVNSQLQNVVHSPALPAALTMQPKGLPQVSVENTPIATNIHSLPKIQEVVVEPVLNPSISNQHQSGKITSSNNDDSVLSEARVMVVNTEHQFLVVGLGTDHGIKEGATLKVLRGNESIAVIVVETVYEKISAAGISRGDIKDIREGDVVSLE